MGQVLFKGKIIIKMQKFCEVILKFYSKIAHIYMNVFWHSADFKFVQIMVPEGQGGGHKKGNDIHCISTLICILEPIF
jgi:hypothetical protein